MLSDEKKIVEGSWYLSASAEVRHKKLFELLERMDTLRLKSRVLSSSSFSENNQKGNTKEGVRCLLEKHESLIAFKMVEWVGGAIVWLDLQHLDLTKN